MAKFYSAATGGFYESELHLTMPDDAKPISEGLYSLLFRDRPEGKIIVAGEDGFPLLADPPAPSDEKIAAAVRNRRDALLREVYDPAASMLQRAIRLGNQNASVKLAEFDAWAVALQEVPEQEGFPHDIAWPTQPSQEL